MNREETEADFSVGEPQMSSVESSRYHISITQLSDLSYYYYKLSPSVAEPEPRAEIKLPPGAGAKNYELRLRLLFNYHRLEEIF